MASLTTRIIDTELSAERLIFGHYKNMPQKRFRYFLKQPRRSLLVLKADDQVEYADLLAEFIRQEQSKRGVSFWGELCG